MVNLTIKPTIFPKKKTTGVPKGALFTKRIFRQFVDYYFLKVFLKKLTILFQNILIEKAAPTTRAIIT